MTVWDRSERGLPVSRSRLWTRHFTILLLATIGVCLVTNMYNIGMTYYADLLQGGIAYAGVSVGVFSLASLIVKPLAGSISNRFDRCRVSVIATLLIGVLAYVHGFTGTVAQLAVIRAAHGAAFAVFATVAAAEVNDTLPRERLSEGLGFYSISSVLVPALGPSLFLILIEEGDIASFDGLFVLSGAISLVSAALLMFGVPAFFRCGIADRHHEEGGVEERKKRSHQVDLPKTYLGFEPATLLPAGFLCLFAFIYASVNFFLPEYAFHVGIGNAGAFYLVFAVSSITARFFVGRYADSHGPDGALAVGMLLCAGCYSAIPFCSSLLGLCVIAVPYGVGMGVVSPLLNFYIVSRCSPERPGSASAAYYAAYDIGYTFGAVLAGVVIAAFGYTTLYISCGAIALSGFVTFRTLLAKGKRFQKS